MKKLIKYYQNNFEIQEIYQSYNLVNKTVIKNFKLEYDELVTICCRKNTLSLIGIKQINLRQKNSITNNERV